MNSLKIYRGIEQDIASRGLKNAMDKLRALLITTRRGDLLQDLENLEEIYKNLLRYFVISVDDMQRDEVFTGLQISVLELADIALQSGSRNTTNPLLLRKREFETQMGIDASDPYTSLNRIFFDEELEKIIRSEISLGMDSEGDKVSREKILGYIFLSLWFTDKLKESETSLAEFVRTTDTYSWYEKCLIVSAVTLSLFRCFDIRKFKLLKEFTLDPETELRHRAYTGLFAGLLFYNRRIMLYPEIREILTALSFNPETETNLRYFLLQVLKSLETEKINKILKEDILSKVEMIKPKITDKLELEKLMKGEYGDERNPDWEKVFEGSPDLLDKLQEMSQLQLDGNDIFMSAFENLKSFSFFEEPANWFKPFYAGNEEITSTIRSDKDGDPESFLHALEKSFFICNSDKHSFCLNMKFMPPDQRKMIYGLFSAELEQMAELSEEDTKLNNPVVVRSIYSRYIQDLYRFFKIHPDRQYFIDIFDEFRDFKSAELILSMNDSEGILKTIAAYLFEKDHFDSARDIFEHILNKSGPDQELFEKLGYCCQKAGLYEEAVDYYKKAELYEPDKPWTLKKIAFCHRKMQQYEEALAVYLHLLTKYPDDLYLHTQAGHCYLDMKNYPEALNHYFRVEFLDQGNVNVGRPIAWCLLMVSKYENALKYYHLLTRPEGNPNLYDFLNQGHTLWLSGMLDDAVKSYSKAMNLSKAGEFISAFNEDIPMLLKSGKTEAEIQYVLDFLKYPV